MKKIISFMICALFLLAVGICSCSSDENNNGTEGPDEDSVLNLTSDIQYIRLTDEQKTFVNQNNNFSFRLFRAISNSEATNKSIITSPISVTFLMGMLNDGASGKTAEEIASVLGFGENGKDGINNYCKALIEQAPLEDPRVKVQIANIIAANQGVELEDIYKQDMQDYYDAEMASLDFSQKSSLDYLNGWCKEKTNGMIPSIIESLNSEDKLVLMNAIYFQGAWQYYFKKEDTLNETFTLSDGSKKDVLMMQRKALINYSENSTYSIIRMPYGNNLWAMYILLPKEGNSIDDIIMSLSNTTWKRSDFYDTTVDIKLPRFKTESDIDLNSIISNLGAPSMFSPSTADFSLISNNTKDLHVGLMKHKAAIDVNEEGTEASAVTTAMMVGSAGGEMEKRTADFHANRPFVYIITEWTTGAVFFIGKYMGE